MPDRGLLDLSDIVAPTLPDGAHGLAFAGSRWAQLTYEVDQAAALGRLPGDTGRPIPTYARLLIIDGPARVALLAVGGRYKMLPRNVVADIVVDGDSDSVAGAIGGPCRAGTVTFERDGGRLVATISDADAGLLATLTLPALNAVDPGMLRWDPWLAFAARDAVTHVAEVTAHAQPNEAFLSKGATLETAPTLPRTHLWRKLRNLQTVSACYCEGDFTFSAPDVQRS